MNKEEAIERLKEIQENYMNSDSHKALTLAIEALEQNPSGEYEDVVKSAFLAGQESEQDYPVEQYIEHLKEIGILPIYNLKPSGEGGNNLEKNLTFPTLEDVKTEFSKSKYDIVFEQGFMFCYEWICKYVKQPQSPKQKPSDVDFSDLQELKKEWDNRSSYIKEAINVITEETWKLFLPHLQFPSVKQCGCMTHCNCPIFQPPVVSDEEIDIMALNYNSNRDQTFFIEGMKTMRKLLTNKEY